MTDDLAELLEQTAVYLKADGNDQEAIGYSRAAESVRREHFIPPNPSAIDGVGSSIRDDIIEYQQTGELSKLNELQEQYPYLESLCRVDGVGPKTARRIRETLGIESPEEIVERADELPEVHRIGEKTASNLVESAKQLSR